MIKREDNNPEVEPLDEETKSRLSAAIAPVAIEPERGARMRARALAIPKAPVIAVVRVTEGRWQSTHMPGVKMRMLHLDRAQGMRTALWRLGPGAYIPPHSHARDEECLVLDGEVVSDDGVKYLKGDFLYAEAGSLHTGMTAPSGALLLLRNQLPTEMQSP